MENRDMTESERKQQVNQENMNQVNSETMHEFDSGAKRSQRMPRYDLIPKCFIDRVAQRFTGELLEPHDRPDEPSPSIPIPTGGAHKYGEGNWEKGLPTSDVINHIIHHLTNYQEKFRILLTAGIHNDINKLMRYVQIGMQQHTQNDDDLAAAAWGISVLMVQETTGMFHDDAFKLVEPVRKEENINKYTPRT